MQPLEYFDNLSIRQNLVDKRLQSIKNKLDGLSQGVASFQDEEEMSCEDRARPGGLLPRLDSGRITSAVTLAMSEEKERDKRKLNVILNNVVNLL